MSDFQLAIRYQPVAFARSTAIGVRGEKIFITAPDPISYPFNVCFNGPVAVNIGERRSRLQATAAEAFNRRKRPINAKNGSLGYRT